MIKTTFEKLWTRGMENDAKNLGVIDGDLLRVRDKVVNLFISAGWADNSGSVEFVSNEDAATALQAARKELNKVSHQVVSERHAAKLTAAAGTTHTKAQVLHASNVSVDRVTLQSTDTMVSAASFSPKMGRIGDKCPRCSGAMQLVALANNKAAIYCVNDRVITPVAQ